MYFFYFDESGSRDLNLGTNHHPTHIYVLLAVGMYEGQWGNFEREVSGLKLTLADDLQQRGFGEFELAHCEVKSNWLRHPKGREKGSAFLTSLTPGERQKITEVYFAQIAERNAVLMAAVIDKRSLPAGITAVTLHQQAYELVLQRIQRYMEIYHRRHRALIVMDDTDKKLNQIVAMQHASFLREGKWLTSEESISEFHFPSASDLPGGVQLTMNPTFPNIVEYPFFTRSELSNGVQLADQLAYNVYRAFRHDEGIYPLFENMLPYFYRSRDGAILHGLVVWPDSSPLSGVAESWWSEHKRKALTP